MIYWLRLFINNWIIRFTLAALFMLMWHGPIRFVYYYPAYIDPWFFVFLLAGLIGIERISKSPSLGSICLLGLMVFIGVTFREGMLIIPAALLFANNPIVSPNDLSAVWHFSFYKQNLKRIPLTFFSHWLLVF